MSADIEAICPGLDCVINCNLALINVDKATPNYDEAGLHRAKDPAAGSITPYHNGTTVVTRRIPAGGELFKFYGNSWFVTRPDFEGVPLSSNYTEAEALLKRYNETVHSLESRLLDNSLNFQATIYEFLMELRSLWNSRTLNALPMTLEQVQIALEQDIGAVYQPNATRSLDFLQSKGRCADHITWGSSTIQGVGRELLPREIYQRGLSSRGLLSITFLASTL